MKCPDCGHDVIAHSTHGCLVKVKKVPKRNPHGLCKCKLTFAELRKAQVTTKDMSNVAEKS